MTKRQQKHVWIPGELTPDERAKLHALGNTSWIRMQLREVPMPEHERSLYQLTEAEYAMVQDLSVPVRKIAPLLNVSPHAIYQSRSRFRRVQNQRV